MCYVCKPRHSKLSGFPPPIQPSACGLEWDVFTKFRAKTSAGRTDWRAFQLALILNGGLRRRKFGGPRKETRAIMLCHRSWVVPGCSTKTDSCKFELVPAQEQRVFDETFTDRLWRLFRYVEDSLLKQRRSVSFHCPSLLLMPACKSNGWSPFRLQPPPPPPPR